VPLLYRTARFQGSKDRKETSVRERCSRRFSCAGTGSSLVSKPGGWPGAQVAADRGPRREGSAEGEAPGLTDDASCFPTDRDVSLLQYTQGHSRISLLFFIKLFLT